MQSNAKLIQAFLNATDANWRNSLYIECKHCDKECNHERDFLFVPGQAGTPLIIPVLDAKTIFSSEIDKTECLSEFSEERFFSLYREWLESTAPDVNKCKLHQALSTLFPPTLW